MTPTLSVPLVEVELLLTVVLLVVVLSLLVIRILVETLCAMTTRLPRDCRLVATLVCVIPRLMVRPRGTVLMVVARRLGYRVV